MSWVTLDVGETGGLTEPISVGLAGSDWVSGLYLGGSDPWTLAFLGLCHHLWASLWGGRLGGTDGVVQSLGPAHRAVAAPASMPPPSCCPSPLLPWVVYVPPNTRQWL